MTGTFMFPRNAFLGFDHLLNEIDNISLHAKDTYPPHNVVKLSDHEHLVELAVAGFSKEDITIEVKEHVLTIVGKRERRRPQEMYIHKGISARKFTKSYRLSEYTEVTGADITDGILVINLEVKLPEERKPKVIKIN